MLIMKLAKFYDIDGVRGNYEEERTIVFHFKKQERGK